VGEPALVRMEQLSKSFYTERVETQALRSIDLEIHQGEYVCFSGPSGCGKSTLLAIIGLLDVPIGGNYWFRGTKVVELSSSGRAAIRNQSIGFVFQSFNLISDLSVAENVMLPLTYRRGVKRQEMHKRAVEVLERLDMGHRLDHYPSQLSGGQQQRVAIARSVVTDPALVLADEPSGNLDSKNTEVVMQLLRDLHREGRTICIVTHDPRASEHATRNIQLLDGEIVSDSALQKPPVRVNAVVA